MEASPFDAVYGAGIGKNDLLDGEGHLLVHPRDWHTKKDPDQAAQNHLGFVLMGLRDLFREMIYAR